MDESTPAVATVEVKDPFPGHIHPSINIYVSIAEAAMIAGCSTACLRKRIKLFTLPTYGAGRTVRLYLPEVLPVRRALNVNKGEYRVQPPNRGTRTGQLAHGMPCKPTVIKYLQQAFDELHQPAA